MKKLFVLLLVLVSLIGSGYVIITRIGNVLPLFLPPLKNTKVKMPLPAKGKQLDFNASIYQGFQIGIFAQNTGHVRVLTFSPGGILLASIPDEGRVIELPDRNHDGIADEISTLVPLLNYPHGIAFYNNYLYIAEQDKVSRYLWNEQPLVGGVARFEKKLFDLPPGGLHKTRSITFTKDGTMYISVGSTCNVCRENNPLNGSVLVSDWQGKKPEIFATGLRNTVFMAINPQTNDLWGTDMARDYLGDNLPPDEINIIKSSGNNKAPNDYGWPYCYGNKVHDIAFDNMTYLRNPCADTIPPLYEIAAHSAPLGLIFINSVQLPESWQNDLLVSYHGSWNRSIPTGYKVVHLAIKNNKIIKEEDFLSGLLQYNSALARPVDLVFDKDGNLYISDDKGGNIFIISKKF